MSDVLVVGANRGIGLEICRQLHGRGDHVTAACRRSSRELDALGVPTQTGVDVTEPATLEALADAIGPEGIDTLLVVAGILRRVGLESFDPAVVREQFEVNALGALQTAITLRGCVRRGGKIGFVTSRMGSIADNTSGGSYGYRMSKAALNMAGRSLAHDLQPAGIAVVLLHPGWVRTEMTGGTGMIDAAESAAGLIARVDELNLDASGSFVHQNGESLPW